MESRAHAIVAVAFLVLFAAGITVLVVWLNQGKPENRIYAIVTTHSVGGLEPKAEVTFKGLTVGHVKQVRFDSSNPDRVRILIGVHPDTPITHATYAQLNSQLIGGVASIKLGIAAGKPQTPLPTHRDKPATLPMRQGFMHSIKQSGQQTLARIRKLLDRAEKMLSAKNQQHFTQTMAHIDQASKKLIALEAQLGPAVSALPRVEKEINESLAESRRAMRQIGQLAAAAHGPLHKAAGAAHSVTQASEAGKALAETLNEDTLPRITALTDRLTHTARDLDRLVQLLSKHPSSVLVGAPKPEAGPGEPGFEAPSVDKRP